MVLVAWTGETSSGPAQTITSTAVAISEIQRDNSVLPGALGQGVEMACKRESDVVKL